MMNRIINFREQFELVNQPREIIANCNTINIINIGTAIAVVNGVEIPAGGQYYVQGNEYEFNESRYLLSFSGAGTNSVYVIRKIYN
jgi:hypothetical protein